MFTTTKSATESPKSPELISKLPYLYLREQLFAAQVATPSAALARVALVPEPTLMTVIVLSQVMETVVPEPSTMPFAETCVNPLTVVKVATTPAATGCAGLLSIITLNAPPPVVPGIISPRRATKVRS